MSIFERLFRQRKHISDSPREDRVSHKSPVPHPSPKRMTRSEVGSYAVGDRIAGRYLVQRIMEGGLGKVFVVSEDASQFVLKTLKVGNPKVREFLDEARTWVRLGRHENIVPAFWVDYVAGMPCVAAEYVAPDHSGRGSMRDHMLRLQPSIVQAIRWCAQFCYGMEHALGRGLIAHRDVKPENLLISPNGVLQITDFGISTASILEGHGKASEGAPGVSISGTPAYMAPEQWLGLEQDFRTDAYAFGIVLYELCFGALPWNARTVPELRRAHLEAKAEVPQHPLQNVIAAAFILNENDALLHRPPCLPRLNWQRGKPDSNCRLVPPL